MIVPTSITTTISTATSKISSVDITGTNKDDTQLMDLVDSIREVTNEITLLRTKTQKKLNKVEDEINNCNFLIDSGIGSKKDQAELRKTKRQLRQRRIKLRDELKPLAGLQEEKIELERQLQALRRRLGISSEEGVF